MRYLLTVIVILSLVFVSFAQEEMSKEEKKAYKDSVHHLKDSLWRVKFQNKIAEDKKKRVLFTVVPGPYAREGGGVGLMVLPMLIYKLDTADHVTPPSYTQGFLLGSSTGTFLGFINQQFFFKEDNWRLQVGGGGGSPRNRYYGIGNSLGENYFWYRQNTAFIWANAYRRIYKRLYFGLGMSVNWFKFQSADKDVDETYTDSVLVADGLNLDWATTSTPSARLNWDSRNSIFYPTKGVQAQITSWFGIPALGSGYNYQKLEAYYNQYIHFDPSERMVLAWRVYLLNTFGDVPFSQYAQYGGKSGKDLRGYVSGQYTDRNMFDAQIEFRWTFWRRLGAAFFFGTGRVFPEYKELLQGPWLPAGGVGLRYQVMRAKRIQARLDFAYGREGFQMYFGIMESF